MYAIRSYYANTLSGVTISGGARGLVGSGIDSLSLSDMKSYNFV